MNEHDNNDDEQTSNDRPHPDYDYGPTTWYEEPADGCILCEADEFEPGYVPQRIQEHHWVKYVGPDYASMRAELAEKFGIVVSETELQEHDKHHVHHGLEGGENGL